MNAPDQTDPLEQWKRQKSAERAGDEKFAEAVLQRILSGETSAPPEPQAGAFLRPRFFAAAAAAVLLAAAVCLIRLSATIGLALMLPNRGY